jgi:hypothetical protein
MLIATNGMACVNVINSQWTPLDYDPKSALLDAMNSCLVEVSDIFQKFKEAAEQKSHQRDHDTF